MLLMSRMKLASEALGRRASLEGTTVGVRLTTPGLKVVTQPNHAQIVVHAVPDDLAATFDCASRLAPGHAATPKRVYGNYFGAAFYIAGAEPVHPAIRLVEHAYSRTFTLVSYPNDFGELAGCAPQVNRASLAENAAREYGKAFGMNIRFLTEAGEGPVMRTLWARDASGWRITAYRVEYP